MNDRASERIAIDRAFIAVSNDGQRSESIPNLCYEPSVSTISSDPPKTTVPESEETFQVVEKALFNLWSVVNELSRIKPPPAYSRFRVTIFGSARIKPGTKLYEDVKHLAEGLSQMGCDVVTGGGPGLMQAANEGEELGDPMHKTTS